MRLEVFGQITLFEGSDRWERFPTARCREIIAFLALADGRSVSRAWLVKNIWPREQTELCRNRLSVNLSLLRTMLREHFSNVLATDRQGIRLQESVKSEYDTFWSTISEFRASECEDDRRRLVQALLTMYRGPLMVDVSHPWAECARLDAHEAITDAALWLATTTGDQALAARVEANCLAGANLR